VKERPDDRRAGIRGIMAARLHARQAMPQFIYRIQPTRMAMLTGAPTETEARVVAEHFQYLQDLTRRGVVLLAGRTLTADDDAFGIVVLEAESEAAAGHLMACDPAVAQGVMRARLWPFRVALASAAGLPLPQPGD
jgi:uncharacterized protein YciI